MSEKTDGAAAAEKKRAARKTRKRAEPEETGQTPAEQAETEQTPGEPAERAAGKAAANGGEPEVTQELLVEQYYQVFHRCMQDDPKSFDAKGALSALDQIGKLTGLTGVRTEEGDGGTIRVTFAGEGGDDGG